MQCLLISVPRNMIYGSQWRRGVSWLTENVKMILCGYAESSVEMSIVTVICNDIFRNGGSLQSREARQYINIFL
jgi:hypothetical protein